MKAWLKVFFLSVAFLSAISTQAIPVFPTVLLDNTTGAPDSRFIGAPDDSYYGIGGQMVTFDFGLTPIFDGVGQDFNVYEVDIHVVEFSKMVVLVSNDGINFFDVKSSEGPALVIPGDEVHGNTVYARSYDLGASPLTMARYLRVDGNGTGPAGQQVDFDLDAVGALNTIDLTAIPSPDGGASGLMMILGLAGLGLCRKFSKLS